MEKIVIFLRVLEVTLEKVAWDPIMICVILLSWPGGAIARTTQGRIFEELKTFLTP